MLILAYKIFYFVIFFDMNRLNSKVFCIGLSRTGTTSLHHFFDKLNIRSLHYSNLLFAHPHVIDASLTFKPALKRSFVRDWIFKKEWSEPNQKQLDRLFREFQVFSDSPIPSFFPYLDKKFSNSKFIYTYREEENWLKSMKWMFENGVAIWNWRDIDFELLYQVYGTYTYDKDKLLNSYRKHHKKVMSYFKDRQQDILIINIDKEGLPLQKISDFIEIKLPEDFVLDSTNKSRRISKLKFAMYHFKRITFIADVIKGVKKYHLNRKY